jgi:hypothetical protein
LQFRTTSCLLHFRSNIVTHSLTHSLTAIPSFVPLCFSSSGPMSIYISKFHSNVSSYQHCCPLDMAAAEQWFADHSTRVAAAMLQQQEDHFYNDFENLCPDWLREPHGVLRCRIHGCPLAFGRSLGSIGVLKKHLGTPAHKVYSFITGLHTSSPSK